MSTRLWSIVIDAADPDRLARFWSAATGWPIVFDDPDDDEEAVVATDRLGLVFVPVPEPKTAKNRVHVDLSAEDRPSVETEVDRLVGLGTSVIRTPWLVSSRRRLVHSGRELCA